MPTNWTMWTKWINSQKYTNNSPKLNQEELENLKRQTTTTRNQSNNQKTPKTTSPGPDGFAGEFYQKLVPRTNTSFKLFQKI